MAKRAWRRPSQDGPPGQDGPKWRGTLRWATVGVALAVLMVLGGSLAVLAVPLFTRIRRHEVLEHATRQRILEAVAARPGMTLQSLQAELGVAWGTTVHHVHVLQRHARLVSVRQGPRRLLYIASTPEGRARADLAILRPVTAHGIALAVHRQPGMQQVEICRLVGVRGPSASKHLSRLAAAGLVTVERAGSACRYRPTPRLGEVLGLRGGREADHPGDGANRPPRPPPPTLAGEGGSQMRCPDVVATGAAPRAATEPDA